MKTGTPKTLSEAIQNGIDESKSLMLMGVQKDLSWLVENHVRDYIAQKFAPQIIEAKGYEAIRLEALWYELTGRKIN